MEKRKFESVDDYISEFPSEVAEKLETVRKLIKQTAPDAQEIISYNMPAFKQKKVLVYFAGYKNHIGLYALPSGNKAFQKELQAYKTGKGSIQFPLEEKLPLNLIRKIVEFRLDEVGKTKK